jgi:hypothetical protein
MSSTITMYNGTTTKGRSQETTTNSSKDRCSCYYEGDDIVRVACARWTPIKGDDWGVEVRNWGRYQFIDVIDYSHDVDETNVEMNSLTLAPQSQTSTTISSQNIVDVKKKARYWYWGVVLLTSTIGLHYQEMNGRRVTKVQNDSPAMDLASRYEDTIYLFDKSAMPRLCTFDTLTEIWQEYRAPPITFPPTSGRTITGSLKNVNRTFPIPKCGIFMYSAHHYPSFWIDCPLFDTTLLYQPMCDKWIFLDWLYPSWQPCTDSNSGPNTKPRYVDSTQWYRSMAWYNNTIVLIPLRPRTADPPNIDQTKEVTPCYMLAPHLITRHYTPVDVSSYDKRIIGDMLVTITLPQRVAIADWIRIDDFPSYTDHISMSATSIY